MYLYNFSLKVKEKPEKAFETLKLCDCLVRHRSRRRVALSPARACFVLQFFIKNVYIIDALMLFIKKLH